MDIDHLVAFLQATDFLIIAGGVGMFLGMISAAQSELNAHGAHKTEFENSAAWKLNVPTAFSPVADADLPSLDAPSRCCLWAATGLASTAPFWTDTGTNCRSPC
jgi:hypothetical protein